MGLFKRKKSSSSIMVDPVEKTEAYLAIRDELEALIKEQMGDDCLYRGSCHRYWGIKKSILKNKYHIHWRSPAELNPHIHFD